MQRPGEVLGSRPRRLAHLAAFAAPVTSHQADGVSYSYLLGRAACSLNQLPPCRATPGTRSPPASPFQAPSEAAACARRRAAPPRDTLITRAPHAQAVEAVAESVRAHGVTNLVVDPVLVATSGDALAADGVARALVTRSARARLRAGARARVARTRAELGACRGAGHAEWPALALTRAGAPRSLFPLAAVATPNLPEASALLGGRHINSVAAMRDAARDLHALGPRAVLVKGGHLPAGAAGAAPAAPGAAHSAWLCRPYALAPA